METRTIPAERRTLVPMFELEGSHGLYATLAEALRWRFVGQRVFRVEGEEKEPVACP